jgi:hypothetical protein
MLVSQTELAENPNKVFPSNPLVTVPTQYYRVSEDGRWNEVSFADGVEHKRRRHVYLYWIAGALSAIIAVAALYWRVKSRRASKTEAGTAASESG